MRSLKTNCKRRWRILAWSGAASLACLLSGWLALQWVPIPSALLIPPPAQAEFTDRDGVPLRAVRVPDHPFDRPVTYFEIPQALVQATLAAEDKRFWHHSGVDCRGSLRAMWSLIRNRRIVSGGSTITQQLIKLAQPRPRTFRTKLIEAVQALRLEQVWGKQRILTEYFNRLDYGNLNTGCAAAAEFYWGKPLQDLSTAECALLAGLPQAPTRLNPLRHFERACKRQQWILERMLATGALSPEELSRFQAERLRLATSQRVFAAPHFVDMLLANPGESVPESSPSDTAVVQRPQRRIRTSLDLALNRFAEQALRSQITKLRPQNVGNAAAVVIDNQSGGVLALVGSEDYFAPAAGQVNGAWRPRSAGSTLKPFTYLLAFEGGATPATVVADIPTEFMTATGLFAPVNYDHRAHGPVRYRLALANSLNIAAVKVLASIGGPAPLQARLQTCGLTTLIGAPEHYGLGLTIGNAEVRLLELANAYACLARLGEFRPYTLIAPSETGQRTAKGGGRQVFDPAASFLIADILSDNAARMLAFGAQSNLQFDFPVACKTGTSSDFRDNWAFGYTPEFTVGVWVGNFDGSPMQDISGVTGAAPIMHAIVEHLHQRFGTSWFPTPQNIAELPIHPITGKQRVGHLRIAKTEWVLEKFMTRRLPPEESPHDYTPGGLVRLPAEYYDWFATSDNGLARQAVVDVGDAPFRITFPLPGTRFYLDPDLPDQGRRLSLKVQGGSKVDWRSPTLQCRSDGAQVTALLEPGEHHLLVRDLASGRNCETWIEVLER